MCNVKIKFQCYSKSLQRHYRRGHTVLSFEQNLNKTFLEEQYGPSHILSLIQIF